MLWWEQWTNQQKPKLKIAKIAKLKLPLIPCFVCGPSLFSPNKPIVRLDNTHVWFQIPIESCGETRFKKTNFHCTNQEEINVFQLQYCKYGILYFKIPNTSSQIPCCSCHLMPTEVLAVVGEVSSNYLRGRNPKPTTKTKQKGGKWLKVKKMSTEMVV